MDENITFGQRLARIRKEKNLTQYELADKLDTVQETISDYENSRRRLNDEALVKLSDALGVTPNDILGFYPKLSNKEDLDLSELIDQMKQLKVEDRNLLIKLTTLFIQERR